MADSPTRPPKPPPPDGVVVIDKPKGPTSHDVVARVRKLLKTRAVGHAGTLDPMATGVLVVAVGEGTKLVPWLTAADKAYEATIRLGVGTDTLDAEGRVVAEQSVPPELVAWAHANAHSNAPSTLPLVEAALASERARTEQVPPAFSAIKIDGVRAHTMARKGEAVELAPRPIEVRTLDLLRVRVEHAPSGGEESGRDSTQPGPDDPRPRGRGDESGRGDAPTYISLDVRIASAKGYFVRSLARDLAAALGTVGHLTKLHRVKSGAFRVEDAVPLESLVAGSLLPLDAAAAKALPVASLRDAETVLAVTQGKRITPDQLSDAHDGPTAWLDPTGHLVAVGERQPDDTHRVLRGFPRPTAT